MKRIVVIFVVLTVALSVGFWFKVRELDAARLGPSGGNGIIEGQEVDISARIPSRIMTVKAQEGDRVEAGQVLVELDCREPNAALSAAKAQAEVATQRAAAARAQVDAALNAARASKAAVTASGAQAAAVAANRSAAVKQEARVKKLKGEGGATEVQLDQISATVEDLGQRIKALRAQSTAAKGKAAAAGAQARAAGEQAKAALAAIQAALAGVQRALVAVGECQLKTPIGGVVLLRALEPGEVVLPGSRVLSVVRLETVKTTFYLPNRELAAAAPGKAVTVVADAYQGRTFKGKILSVAAEAEFTPRNVQTREDRDRLVFQVKVAIPNPKEELRPGMPVEVTIDGTGVSE